MDVRGCRTDGAYLGSGLLVTLVCDNGVHGNALWQRDGEGCEGIESDRFLRKIGIVEIWFSDLPASVLSGIADTWSWI